MLPSKIHRKQHGSTPYDRPPVRRLPSPSEVRDEVQKALPLVDELFASRHMLMIPNSERVNPVRFLIECALCHGKFMKEMGVIERSEFDRLERALTKHLVIHNEGDDPYAYGIDIHDLSLFEEGEETEAFTTGVGLFSGLPQSQRFDDSIWGNLLTPRYFQALTSYIASVGQKSPIKMAAAITILVSIASGVGAPIIATLASFVNPSIGNIGGKTVELAARDKMIDDSTASQVMVKLSNYINPLFGVKPMSPDGVGAQLRHMAERASRKPKTIGTAADELLKIVNVHGVGLPIAGAVVVGTVMAIAYHYTFTYMPERVKEYNTKFLPTLAEQASTVVFTVPTTHVVYGEFPTPATNIDVTVYWANKFVPGLFAPDTAKKLKDEIAAVKLLPIDNASTTDAVESAYEALENVIDTARREFGWTDTINQRLVVFMREITNNELSDFIPGPSVVDKFYNANATENLERSQAQSDFAMYTDQIMRRIVVVRKTSIEMQNDDALYQGPVIPAHVQNAAKHLKGAGIEQMITRYVQAATELSSIASKASTMNLALLQLKLANVNRMLTDAYNFVPYNGDYILQPVAPPVAPPVLIVGQSRLRGLRGSATNDVIDRFLSTRKINRLSLSPPPRLSN